MGAAYEKGLILYRQRRYKDAASHFGEAAQDDAAARVQAHAMLALALDASGSREPAEAAARRALELDPADAFSHYALGHILLTFRPTRYHFNWRRLPRAGADERRRQIEQSIVEARSAIALKPTVGNYYELLATGEVNLQRWRRALDAVDAGLSHDPGHGGCARLRSLALRQLGRSDRAFEQSRRGLAVHPTSPELHAEAAWAALELGHAKAAIEHFEESLRGNPNDAGARWGLRLARFAAHDLLSRVFVRIAVWTSTGGRVAVMIVAGATGLGVGMFRDHVSKSGAATAAFVLCFVPPLLFAMWIGARATHRPRARVADWSARRRHLRPDSVAPPRESD